MTAMPGFHRITVQQYHRMIETGVFSEDDRVELLDGLLVEKMPHDPIHDGTIQLVDNAVMGIAPAGWCSRIQLAVTLSSSEPEPDFLLARGTKRSYLARHPSPPDVGLVVEVSNSSLDWDRSDKLRIYARSGLAVYWIVNVVDMQIEVHEQPSGSSYGTSRTYRQ